MMLKSQKRIAAQLMKCSPKRVIFDSERLTDIKEAITKLDIKALIGQGVITKKPVKSVSRSRVRKMLVQKRKRRQSGAGSKKGKSTARLPKKKRWMGTIRLQRAFLDELREKGIISKSNYRQLYLKAKGGYFRSKRHIKLYLDERKLIEKK
ncbi:MAG: 50S ribosomal protein L19e [bacterium]|nr:50S ribosomal protein L19e [bacterium]